MQTAEHILQAMRKMGEKRTPLERAYRNLFSEDLFLTAYDKIARNKGALTAGNDERDTVDGMSLERVQRVIEQLRDERFRFTPVRRVQKPKKSGGFRPLGMPNFTDKLVQEALRMLLEAYYEPRFSGLFARLSARAGLPHSTGSVEVQVQRGRLVHRGRHPGMF